MQARDYDELLLLPACFWTCGALLFVALCELSFWGKAAESCLPAEGLSSTTTSCYITSCFVS